MVMSPNFSRWSRAFQMRVRRGGNAIPPATKTRFLPKNSSVRVQANCAAVGSYSITGSSFCWMSRAAW